MLKLSHNLRAITTYFVLTLLCGNPLWADDTEIFFSPVSKVEAQPNIVLLLDASASMLFYDCTNGKRQWNPCNDGSENGNKTRLDRANAGLIEILKSATAVNIGIMRFSNNFAGAKVIYPVRNVDLELCDGVACDDDVEFSGTRTTVRQELIDTLLDMQMNWVTPTVGGMIESAYYWQGSPVYYGKSRQSATPHKKETAIHSRVSHPDSYTGGEVVRSGDCTDDDLAHEDCAGEHITGEPVYISPIANECQSNHMILVSDGEASSDAPAISLAQDVIDGSCPTYTNFKGRCAVEVADYLFENDLRPDLDGSQNVTTHTIGFNLNSNWLKDIATATRIVDGTEQPGYYTAESSAELVEAFSTILTAIETETTTFVAPAATVDRFSRVSHRNDVYMSLFDPSELANWSGNLKRYDLQGVPAELYDSNNPPLAVIDNATGQFRAGTKSFWSAEADGHDITVGGAASKLNYLTRKTVTYSGTEQKSLFHEDNALSIDNTLLDFVEDYEPKNVAPTGTASQSSTAHGGSPGRAIDSNTNGIWNNRSVTHTNNEVQPWWQLSLPQASHITRIDLYNRINCCTDRLSDVNVFVSEVPFGSATLNELKNDPAIWHGFLAGEQSPGGSISINTTGQYIRIQLEGHATTGKGTLSLAEVEVYAGDDTEERTKKQNIIDWAIGKDVKDADEDGDIEENRFHMGDPLHSNPATVTYGGTASDPDSLIFVGTNEGYLHAINSRDGSEQFAFMPQELIENLELLYNDDNSGGKIYGMDGSLTLWTDDKNLDGQIDSVSGEHAYLYAGMRRGGSSYYALDVSDKEAPQFKWQIKGGSGGTAGFEELGDTWSKMQPAKIRYGSTTKKVLVFGGGYDDSQDDKLTRAPDSVGRALYIVDADTGDLLWSGGPGEHNETQKFDDMVYSIPASPKLIDIDGNGTSEQIYVGDMGGRLWRFDINEESETLELDGGIIADLGTDDVMSDARRFYHTPDISISIQDSQYVLNIGIGSGYQAHPLDTTIEDRFYLLRYAYRYAGEGNYGLPQTSTTNSDGETIEGDYEPITESDLYNATDNIIGEGTEEEIYAAQIELAEASGWFIELKRSGEKVLGASETFDNKIMFTSYIPTSGADPCSPNVGSGSFWALNLWDATPAVDFDENDTELTTQDRYKTIPSEGLPPAPQTLIVHTTTTDENGNEEENGIQIITMSGGNTLLSHDVDSLIERVYWSEYPNF